MRANLDGSNIETLVDTSQGDPRPGPDATKWCVGVAIDVDGGKVYWTQKGPDNAGRGRIFRAGIEIPTGQTAPNRADIEVLYDGLPEPIDLDLDLEQPRHVLDRSGRSAARQHGESRADGFGCEGPPRP